jgi:DNA-binding NarL/FixJ family response regulator
MATASIAVGSARRPARVGATKSQIVVIDPQKLRQAALVRLLEEWAETNGLIILAISTPEDIGLASNCAVVVLNLGGASVLENSTQLWMKLVRSVLTHAPLVIFSDREERNEITAAFEQGARGFVTTNVEPRLAMEALTFLRRGGSFFPPSMVERETQSPPIANLDAPGTWEEPTLSGRAVLRVSARLGRHQSMDGSEEGSARSGAALTPRQFEVLERLREGKANKLIARDLNMTEATVKVHVRQIMRKLGAANRTQAVLCAIGIDSAREEPAGLVSVRKVD